MVKYYLKKELTVENVRKAVEPLVCGLMPVGKGHYCNVISVEKDRDVFWVTPYDDLVKQFLEESECIKQGDNYEIPMNDFITIIKENMGLK